MDCSFTLLVGVLGVSSEGVVPPSGRFSPLPLLDGAVPPPASGHEWCGMCASRGQNSAVCHSCWPVEPFRSVPPVWISAWRRFRLRYVSLSQMTVMVASSALESSYIAPKIMLASSPARSCTNSAASDASMRVISPEILMMTWKPLQWWSQAAGWPQPASQPPAPCRRLGPVRYRCGRYPCPS